VDQPLNHALMRRLVFRGIYPQKETLRAIASFGTVSVRFRWPA
jgi:hypothetical protein